MGDFGIWVRAVRKKQELSYRQLAERICDRKIMEVTPTMLNSVEKGKKLCSYDLAVAIALELQINAEQALRVLKDDRIAAQFEREHELLGKAIKRTGVDIEAEEIWKDEG